MSATKHMWANRFSFLGFLTSPLFWTVIVLSGVFSFGIIKFATISFAKQDMQPISFNVAEKFMTLNVCYRTLALESVKNEVMLTNKSHKEFVSKCGITNIDELNRQKDLLLKFN